MSGADAERDAPLRRPISEQEWSLELGRVVPLHQWGSVFLVDEGDAVEAWMRDVTGAARHTVLRFVGPAAERLRAGVAAIEAASDRAADVVSELAARSVVPLEDMRRQEQASQRFVQLAEEFYRELLDGR